MIISEFAKFLQLHNDEILMQKVIPIELLPIWISEIMKKNPKNNVEKVVHKEILYCENSEGESVIIGKSDSGRRLVKSLIEFAKSYNNYTYSKWLNMTNNLYYSAKE